MNDDNFTVGESVVDEISMLIQQDLDAVSGNWTEAEMDFLSDLFDVTDKIEG